MAAQSDTKTGGALKEALFAALITLALCTPIIMFRTESDANSGSLYLIFRPVAVLVFMAAPKTNSSRIAIGLPRTKQTSRRAHRPCGRRMASATVRSSFQPLSQRLACFTRCLV